MAIKYDYSGWSVEELTQRIQNLEKRRSFGVVWDLERTEEEVVKECKDNLPVLTEVKDFELSEIDTESPHIFIEGDNYHALSVLNYTHYKKIDIIYIDPPYNTGKEKEWKFNDKWVDKEDDYRHSKWLSFMSKRLKLAKDLLSDRGVILISIDDNEYAQLKMLCDQIFLEKRYIGTLVWEKKKKGSHLDSFIINIKEYVLVYCKDENNFKGLIGEITEKRETYPCINPGNTVSRRTIPKGIKSNYREKDYFLEKDAIISRGNMQLKLISDLVIKNGILAKNVIIESEWRYTQDNIKDFADKGELYITNKRYIRRVVTKPRYKKLKDLLLRVEDKHLLSLKDELIEELNKDVIDENDIEDLLSRIQDFDGSIVSTDFNNLYLDGWGSNEDADNEQRDFFGKKVFDYPKPVKLIQKLLAATRIEEGIVLDFFAGTGTTGHATLKLNEIGYNLQFILCTNNEDDSDDGLKIATDICYPRIKKVIKGYKRRNGEWIEPLKANLKYLRTDLIPFTPTDKNKELLTNRSVEMICLRENTFDFVDKTDHWILYKNNYKLSAILFNQFEIQNFKGSIKDYDLPIRVYVFSLADDDFSNEFGDLENVTACSIPEAILCTYRRIFK